VREYAEDLAAQEFCVDIFLRILCIRMRFRVPAPGGTSTVHTWKLEVKNKLYLERVARVDDDVGLDAATQLSTFADIEEMLHLIRGEVLHFSGARVDTVARRNGKAPGLQFVKFLLRALERKLVLSDTQLHGTGDGLTLGIHADDLAAFLVRGTPASKVSEQSLSTGLICAERECLADSCFQ
jgi:hypothetical protein